MPDKKEIVLQRCKDAIDSGEPIMDYRFYYEVIDLLKEQKPVKPTKLLNEKVVSYNNVVYQYSCGNCSTLLRNSWKACPLCGKMVKWE